MEKPVAFNYQDFVAALERIKQLEAELEGWKEVCNTQRIRIRILEGDKNNGAEIHNINRSEQV